jgi:prepilin-type N-terminal cleavage/methylation domain-containing protein
MPIRPHTVAPRRPGFSLVELLVVVAILVILIALLVPALGGARDSARNAATQSLMASVSAGFVAFKADTGRQPGVFTQRELHTPNFNNIGLTPMENAMLELAGGVVTSADGSDPQNAFRITMNQRSVFVDPSLIGDRDGPGYVDLGGDALRPVEGQLDQPADDPEEAVPDVIDPFGQPLLLWQQNELAGPNPDVYAAVNSGNRNVTAWFYAEGNFPMLRSRALGFERKRNQQFNSVLGGVVNGSSIDDIVSTVQAITGHPAFPNGGQGAAGPQQPGPGETALEFGPARPLGEIVLHSAGANGIYLDRQDGALPPVRRAVYVSEDDDSPELGAGELPMSKFDDIVLGGG